MAGRRATILVEAATVARMDRMVQEHRGGFSGVDDYDALLGYAFSMEEEATPAETASAMTVRAHRAATLGSPVSIEVDAFYRDQLDKAVSRAQRIVTAPTYGTVIGWLLDVAAVVAGWGHHHGE